MLYLSFLFPRALIDSSEFTSLPFKLFFLSFTTFFPYLPSVFIIMAIVICTNG